MKNIQIVKNKDIFEFMDNINEHIENNCSEIIVVNEDKSIQLDLSAKMNAFLNKAKELDYIRRNI